MMLKYQGVAVQRAAKVTLKFTTQAKRDKLAALLRRYRSAVNFFIGRLWADIETTYHDLTDSRLSARYRSAALRQADNIVVTTRKACAATGNTSTKPHFTGTAILDAKFITIEAGTGHFDLAIRISSLVNGERIVVLTKATRVLNKWLAVPGAKLIQGCGLADDHLVLWASVGDEAPKEEGYSIGIDIGVNKLISTSEEEHFGTDFKDICDKLRRKKPGSAGHRRACAERKNFINRTVNQLAWGRIRVIGVERLRNLKKGKKPNRGKTFRKAISPWTYCQVIERVKCKAQENRVRLVEIDPAYTSQTCPVCKKVSKENRVGEHFQCVSCAWSCDADTVGALNVLARTTDTLRSLESRRLLKANDKPLK
jgi:IS605 OrfB family transposase